MTKYLSLRQTEVKSLGPCGSIMQIRKDWIHVRNSFRHIDKTCPVILDQHGGVNKGLSPGPIVLFGMGTKREGSTDGDNPEP